VRDRLNSAVRSRMPEKVEEALAASRAISTRFVRPPEHEFAIASLDTIREERALRPKLIELSEIKVDERTSEESSLRKYVSVMHRLVKCRETDPYAFKDEISAQAELVYAAMRAKMDTEDRLVEAKERLCPSEMMDALRECDALALRFSGVWSEHLFESLKSELRRVLVAIQHEEPSLTGILRACASEDEIFANPELLFTRSACENLETAIAKAVDDLGILPITPGANLVLSLGNAVLALKRSLGQQHGSKSSARWNSSEKLLGDARLTLKAWSDSLPPSQSKNDTPDYFASWVAVVERELDLISAQLDKKAGVHDIIAALQDSVERCDVDDIRNLLRKGEKRGLHERLHDTALQETLRLAHEYVEKYSAIHARLMEAFAAPQRDPAELRRLAIVAQQQVLPNSTDARLVDEFFRLCDHAEKVLGPMIRIALEEMPDRIHLEKLVQKIKQDERMGGMQELAAVEELLELSEVRLIQEQLRAAARKGDEGRKTKLMIRIRTIHLEQNPAMFRVSTFADLKDPREWSQEASAKRMFPVLKRDARASRMLISSRTPLHATLTKGAAADPKLQRFALKANRTLLTYTGDFEVDDLTEFGGEICLGMHELLSFGLSEPNIRDEIYCQLIKHLTENKRPGSITRTWNAFAFCLITFPPSQCFDLYVEHFIRLNAPAADQQSLLDKLHLIVFAGERPTAPTLNDIKQRQDDGGSVEGLCRRPTSAVTFMIPCDTVNQPQPPLALGLV
jgi:hypothetical protein